jgi:hypothetical protein
LVDHYSLGFEPSGGEQSPEHFDPAPRHAADADDTILYRLQRTGSALNACECGSHNWLPPDGIYQLQAVSARTSSAIRKLPTKAIVPLTCAACGLTKFYDPAVVAARSESVRRW